MANLAKSNALWFAFYKRIQAAVGCHARDLSELRDRFSLGRVQVIEKDPNANTFAGYRIVVAGVRWATNTDKRQRFFQRITGGPTPYTVKWYKATGGGGSDEVASGTANAGAVAAMTASNSSGITGSIKLAGSVTGETDDKHELIIHQDALSFARDVFDGTDPEGKDASSLLAIGDAYGEIAGHQAASLDVLVRLFERLMTSDPANGNAIAYGSRFLGTTFTNLLTEQPQANNGLVTVQRSGALVALLQDQKDEATGSTQTFVRRRVDAGAGVAGTNNQGLGTIAAHVPLPECPTGTLRLECVAGYGDGSHKGGVEEFEATLTSDITDRVYRFARRVVVKQSYSAEHGVGPFTIARTISKTGDGTNVDLHAIAGGGFTVTGETEDNTSGGDVWAKMVASGGNWIAQVYKTSAAAVGDLIAQAAAVAAGAAFDAQPTSGGISLQGTVGSAPTGVLVKLSLNFFRSANTAGERDYFTIPITLTDEGDWSRWLAKLPVLDGTGYAFDGVASGGELISDEYAKANCLAALFAGPRN